MDRCPECRGPLAFYGIQKHPLWARWTYCRRCLAYTLATPEGALIQAGVRYRNGAQLLEPPRHYFTTGT